MYIIHSKDEYGYRHLTFNDGLWHYVKKAYLYYTKKEAIKDFKQLLKSKSINTRGIEIID